MKVTRQLYQLVVSTICYKEVGYQSLQELFWLKMQKQSPGCIL